MRPASSGSFVKSMPGTMSGNAPLLRVALQDRAFFVRPQHPARQLLNAVAESGATWLSDDEVDPQLALIKGGGGALTREKIIAQASRRFVCIVDESKQVQVLGSFPLPVEVIPMARSLVTRELQALGATVTERDGFVTDNGNRILDAAGLKITDPLGLEAQLNQWPGVVTVGLFARRRPDVLLIAGPGGVVERGG